MSADYYAACAQISLNYYIHSSDMNYRTAFILIEETISSSVYTLNFKLIAIQYRKSGFFRGISFRAKRMPHMICNILFFCVRYF